MSAVIVGPLEFLLRRCNQEERRNPGTRVVHPEWAIPPHPLAGSRDAGGDPVRVWPAEGRLPRRSPSPVLSGDMVQLKAPIGNGTTGFVVKTEQRDGRLYAHVKARGVAVPILADLLEVVRP